MKNEAVGAYEAAGLLGVHFTRPKRMADMGLIATREIESTGGAVFAVYSAKECEDNFLEYRENYEGRRRAGEKVGRPRAFVGQRQHAIGALSDPGRPQISFEDAVGVVEAAKILGVYYTRVVRIVQEGKIVGRVLWSERGGRSKLWIFSRASCEAHAAAIKKLEAAGLKKGRPRAVAVRKR
jgi:hypothetical protein